MTKELFFASNLKHLRKQNNLEQQELAEMLGRKSGSTVSDWERGKVVPRMGTLDSLASILKTDIDSLLYVDLVNPEKTNKPNNIVPISNFVKIPRLGEIACGDPITAIENVNSYKEVPQESLPSGDPKDLFFLEAKGDSMEPKIPNGSDVLCRKQNDVENGEIAAVLLNDFAEVTLKRVKKADGFVLLEPINDKYETHVLTPDSPGKIVGKAVKVEYNL